MDKCQQFIAKVSELRFLKIKERQVNKFNRLMIKKQGNITWFSTVPLVNPQAGSASPQVASTSVPQTGSSWEDSASQTASASSPQTVSFQAVSSQAVSCPQAGSSQEDSTSQAASASSPQTVNAQAVSSNFSQAESADPQVVSAPVFQPVNSQEDSAAQAVSTSQPASTPQTVSSQAVSTDPQVVNTSASQAGSPREDSASQAASASSQAGSLREDNASQAANISSQTHNTNSQGASATLPQAPKTSRQPSSTNTPWGSPRGNSLENPNHKWVINLSSKPLTQAQRSVLAKGLNFVVSPRHPPNLEYVTAIEAACSKIGQQDAEELRAQINRVLRSSHPNLT